MHRLFLAIRPPQVIRDALIDTMEGLDGVRWQDEAQLHLTLRFIGEVETPVANDLAAALGHLSARPFTLALAGVGHFARGTAYGKLPTALWAGLAPSPGLIALQRKVERMCQSCGLPPETRRFTPHITLARLNRGSAPAGGWLAAHAQLSSAPFAADHVTLFESSLTHAGAHYEPVLRHNLG